MDDKQQRADETLRQHLRKHGFSIAAEQLRTHYWPLAQIEATIVSWRRYPGCMNKYAKQLRPRMYIEH